LEEPLNTIVAEVLQVSNEDRITATVFYVILVESKKKKSIKEKKAVGLATQQSTCTFLLKETNYCMWEGTEHSSFF